MIPVLIGISILIFTVFAMAPGDVTSLNMDPKMSAQTKAEIRHKLHLDEPKYVQYGYWAKGAIKLDFGESSTFKKPVLSVINDYIWNSFYLSVTSFIVSILLAIPIGVISATKQYSIFDNVFTVFALMGISIPSFFFAYLIMKWFAVDLKILPVSGMHTPGTNYTGMQNFLDILKHMVLPFIVLTMINLAEIMRYTRSSMLEVIRQDYVRTARAKG